MDGPLLCTQEAINAAADTCQYVQMACGSQSDYIDFISFYYCDLNENTPLIVVLAILFILFTFNLLGTTADRYLGPSLDVVAENLQMSETIAGVTLLALANGATDVIAGIVAGGKENGGVQIAIGGLFGACLFTVTCVLARCIQGAENNSIKVEPANFKRDIVFLLTATFYFVFLSIIDKITPLLAFGFFVIYAIYFAYVVYQEKQNHPPQETVKEYIQDIQENYKKNDHARSKSLNLDSADPDVLNTHLLKKNSRDSRKSVDVSSIGSDLEKKVRARDSVTLDPAQIEDEEEDNTCLGKCLKVYNAPFFFLRDLTMPPFEEERWNVYTASVTPFFGILFAIWQFGLLETFLNNWYLWVLYFAITMPFALWIFINGRTENLVKHHAGKMAGISFVVSALWLNLIANCFMDFLALITVISHLPLNYLSLTTLAWGNSLDDFFIDYYVAKGGHGAMAVTGVYAGQLFNLLIGFGGSMFRQSLTQTIHPNIFIFTGETSLANTLTMVLLTTLVICLISTLFIGKLNKWVLGRRTMIFLLLFYIGFLGFATLISIGWKHVGFIST